LGHERATETCLHRQRRAEARDITGACGRAGPASGSAASRATRGRCTRSPTGRAASFFRAESAGSVKDAYAVLDSKLGRKQGTTEVTDLFLVVAAVLLVLAGALSALWPPRLP
jgi:hypothetical protein